MKFIAVKAAIAGISKSQAAVSSCPPVCADGMRPAKMSTIANTNPAVIPFKESARPGSQGRNIGVRALPVMKEEKVVGIITIEDIGRIYAMASQGSK